MPYDFLMIKDIGAHKVSSKFYYTTEFTNTISIMIVTIRMA